MRKIHILFIMFILASAVYAQEQVKLNLADQTYSPGETVQLEILTQDPEVEPSASNLRLFDSNSNEVKVAPLLRKIKKDNYYFYFDLPDSLTFGEYKLVLSNLRFKINNTLIEVSSETKFNVEASKPTLSIKPALFLADKNTKELELQLTNKDLTTPLLFSTSDFIKHPYEKPEILSGLTSRKFYFNLDLKDIIYDTQGFINLSYENKSYSIPVFVFTGLQTIVETETSLPIEVDSVEETPVQQAEIPKTQPTLTETEEEEELFKLPPPVTVTREPESKLGLYLTIFAIVVIAAIIYKLTRKEKQKKTFKEYVSTIKR